MSSSPRLAVTRTNIIGTRFQVYSAWQEAPQGQGFSTITHLGDVCFGRIGTSDLPEEIEAIPSRTRERSAAFWAWRQQTYGVAYDLICTLFPEAKSGKPDMGHIEMEADTTGSETRFFPS